MPQQVDKLSGLTVLIDEYTDANKPSIVMVFDAVIRESHKLSAKITEFPVETGVIISDHIIHNPIILDLESVITNTPINLLDTTVPEHIVGSALYNTSSQVPPLMFTPGTYILPQNVQEQPKLGSNYYNVKTPDEPRARAAYATLRNYYNAGTPLKVVTGLAIYPNMVITSISTTRDSKTTESWIGSATLQQVIFAKNAFVNLKPKAKKLPRNSKKKIDKGECVTGVREYPKERGDYYQALAGSDQIRISRVTPPTGAP